MKVTPSIRARLQEVGDGRLTATDGLRPHYRVRRIGSIKAVPPTHPMVTKLEKAGLIVFVPNPNAHEEMYAYLFLAQLTPAGAAALKGGR